MDYGAVSDQISNLTQELDRLGEDPSVDVSSILKLVEMEIQRLNGMIMYLEGGEVYGEDDGLRMIACVSNVFGLRDASSIERLIKGPTGELRISNLRFQPPLLCIARLIPIVAHRLGQRLSREYPDENHLTSFCLTQDKSQTEQDDYISGKIQ